jgi:hypothetical protein
LWQLKSRATIDSARLLVLVQPYVSQSTFESMDRYFGSYLQDPIKGISPFKDQAVGRRGSAPAFNENLTPLVKCGVFMVRDGMLQFISPLANRYAMYLTNPDRTQENPANLLEL